MNTEIREVTVDDSAIRPLSGDELDLVSGGQYAFLRPTILSTVYQFMINHGQLKYSPPKSS